jgi:hypothetical protein
MGERLRLYRRYFFRRYFSFPWVGLSQVEKAFVEQMLSHGSAALPFVIPSEAEGSAVQRTFPGNVCSGDISPVSEKRGLPAG